MVIFYNIKNLYLRFFLQALAKQGVEIIEPKLGDDFNPELHEAMTKIFINALGQELEVWADCQRQQMVSLKQNVNSPRWKDIRKGFARFLRWVMQSEGFVSRLEDLCTNRLQTGRSPRELAPNLPATLHTVRSNTATTQRVGL